MTFQKAQEEKLSEYVAVYQNARRFMADNGNPHQWEEKDFVFEVKNDIKNGVLYEIRNDSQVLLGVFAMLPSPDPTYGYIDGKWLTAGPYVVLHRVASSFAEGRFLDLAVSFAEKQSVSVRIDTHKDNLPMQFAIRRCGFSYCGIIYLEDGAPRLAFERVTT